MDIREARERGSGEVRWGDVLKENVFSHMCIAQWRGGFFFFRFFLKLLWLSIYIYCII